MLVYSLQEILLIVILATAVDWLIGDPKRLVHPVVLIGRLVRSLELQLYREHPGDEGLTSAQARRRGVLLLAATLFTATAVCYGLVEICRLIHPWLAYAAHVWLISTTIAVKGLKQAAEEVYQPLLQGRLEEARQAVGRIVGRDTEQMDEREVVRAAVETVAENTVDAYAAPVLWALVGGAPLAMMYRAANTLDSMVGYRNDRYRWFGWASARFDDLCNYLPARLTGLLMVGMSALHRQMSAKRALLAILCFAEKHPSPNSGIPEAAAAGAMGVELGGVNNYGGIKSERARLGWPLTPLAAGHIRGAVWLLMACSYGWTGGLAVIWASLTFAG